MLDLSLYPPSPILWLYTNVDCNLSCSYCVTKSTPNVPRRALGLSTVQRLVDAVKRIEQELSFGDSRTPGTEFT